MVTNDDTNLANSSMNQPGEQENSTSESTAGADDCHLGIPMARPIGLAKPTGSDDQPTSALLLNSISIGAAWLDLLVIVLALVTFEFTSAMFIHAKWGSFDQLSDEKLALINQTILPYIVGGRALLVVIVIAVVSRSRRLACASVGFTTHGFGKNCFVGVAALGVAWSLIFVCQMLMVNFVPSFVEEAIENGKKISKLLPQLPLIGYFMLALSVGIYEELLFRGFILPRLRRATGSWALAIVLSTVVFVAMHLSTQTVAIIAPITILSITFCLTTIWRQSLVPAIVGHALFDLIQFLAVRWVNQ